MVGALIPQEMINTTVFDVGTDCRPLKLAQAHASVSVSGIISTSCALCSAVHRTD